MRIMDAEPHYCLKVVRTIMGHPLDGCRAKIRRADEHLRALISELDQLTRQRRHQHPVTIAREGEWYVVGVAPPQEPPPVHLSTICGDAVQNIRSSLDYIICELAHIRTQEEPTRWNAFPIFTNRAQFAKTVENSRPPERGPLYGLQVGGKAWVLTETLQPYHGPVPEQHILALLARLSNRDKHRALNAQMAFPKLNLPELLGWNPEAPVVDLRAHSDPSLHAGPCELVRLRFAPNVEPGLHVKGPLSLVPTFGDEFRPGKPATQVPVSGIISMREHVNVVIEVFAMVL
jgi:hypothetical protein